MAGVNAVISANPIGILIALVAGLITYFVHLYNTSETFRDGCKIAWEWLVEKGKEFKENWTIGKDMIVGFFTKTIPDTWEKFKGDLANAMGVIAQWATVKVPQFFKDCWQSIKDTFSNVGNWFENTFNNAWRNVKNVFSSWGDFFSGLWDRIKNTFSSLGTTLGDAIGGAVKSGINGVLESIENIINNAIGLINGAIGLINNIPGVSIGYMDNLSLPRLAKGGIISSPTIAQIGEDGQEAVVPLQNNLGWLKTLASQLADELNSGVAFNNSTSSNVTNNFYQTNNSPKSLSRLEIYRQSKNLLSFKGG
jgi:phage-related protein